MLYIIKYISAGAHKTIRVVRITARSEDAAIQSFRKKHGLEPRIISVSLDV